MQRRKFLMLGATVGLSSLTGCAESATQQTTTTDPATTSAPDSELGIEFSGLQTGFVELLEDAYEITAKPDTQYLFLDVTVTSGPRPPISEFTFSFYGETYTPTTEWEHPPLHRGEESSRTYPDTTGQERYQSDGETDGWIAFQLPEAGDASEATLSWPGGEWTPDESVRTRLANPVPTFTIEEWSVPETVSPDTDPEFGFTVRNEGSHGGHFWGAIDGDGFTTDRLVTLVSQRIPPGESKSWVVTGGTSQMGPPDQTVEKVTYTFLWPGENPSKSARVTSD